MEEQWLTANQAAEWLGCSLHTIYGWIHETHDGTAAKPLLLKPRSDNMGGRGKSWLIGSQSLLVADGSGEDGSRIALTTRHHLRQQHERLIVLHVRHVHLGATM